eukprot:467294_1
MAEAKQEIPVYSLQDRSCCLGCSKNNQVVTNEDYHTSQQSARDEASRVRNGQVAVKSKDPTGDPTAADVRRKLCRGAMLQGRGMGYPQYNNNVYHSVPKGIYYLCKALFPDAAPITKSHS